MMSNITHVVNTDKNLKVLKKAVHASDMDLVLSSTGPHTFFAPSDLAFEKLEKGFMEKLLEPQYRPQLADLVKNHIVAGRILFKELRDGDILKTINNKDLKVEINGEGVHINQVPVKENDSKASNGVIHSLDTLLLTLPNR